MLRVCPDNAEYLWTPKTGNLKAIVSLSFTDFNIQIYDHNSHCEDYLQVGIRDQNGWIKLAYIFFFFQWQSINSLTKLLCPKDVLLNYIVR